MALPPLVLKRGNSVEHSTLINSTKYKISGTGASVGEHVLGQCAVNVTSPPTVNSVNAAFAAAYNDLVLNMGFSGQEDAALTLAKAGVCAYVASYGLAGVNQNQVTLATVQFAAKFVALVNYEVKRWDKPLGWVNDLVVDIAMCVAAGQVPASQYNTIENAIQTALNTYGFWET